MANTLAAQGGLYWRWGRFDKARPLLERALTIYEKVRDPDHPDIEKTLITLANVYDLLGKRENAEALRLRANAMKERRAKRK